MTVSTANFNSFTAQLLTERQYRVEVWGENKVRIPTAAGGALSLLRAALCPLQAHPQPVSSPALALSH